MFTRVFGDSTEKTIAEEQRLFYVALTRASERLIILTEKDNLSPFLEDLQGTAALSWLNWLNYPPVVSSSKRIIVKVGNQEGHGGNGTFAIRDMLKAEGFKWKSTGWTNWCRTFAADGFSVERFAAQAVWGKAADGVEIRFFDDFGKMIAIYRVDDGQWKCLLDNIPREDVVTMVNKQR